MKYDARYFFPFMKKNLNLNKKKGSMNWYSNTNRYYEKLNNDKVIPLSGNRLLNI